MNGRRRLSCLVAVLLVGVFPSGIADGAPVRKVGAPATVSVVSFNVLAPIWAAPKWYPPTMDPSVLGADFRRQRIVSFLRDRAAATDVFCLQEVQDSEFRAFQRELGKAFAGSMAVNDRAWWSSYIVPELGWAPNGTAVFVKKSSITAASLRDVALGDGNHASLVDGTLTGSGGRIHVASVHLDSDRNNNRLTESRAVMAEMPQAAGTVDVVCGDLNEDAVTGSAGHMLTSAGFVDVLAAVGNREPTHPFSSSYYASARWAIIDHVLVRGAQPVAGDVVDNGLWSITDEVARIEENLRLTGSDHFPVVATATR